ncbi:MBL fold metallo-hydrolase [Halapricum desulfuricans]|uniref:Metal-dependent hydrolase of the beta-lactamase superfamily II n=1 Tax=Halapricum desulfuricans TaxID=2841257 RepID=A0A897NCP6_9EURY|nr:MBL fold metallo-hydrolase [Halapricum desulfuricans]QSG10432.1 Metal-dependent hydrolase of the beta-lactamase superfamily II [Halapricum desulfuricans]QSG13397.1 Metal-dependent hydrolase of the beta-lactamase superfamily II [Halapricum desulfuricans]
MATELIEGVWWFDLRGVNAYLVEDGDTLTLVDAGTPLSRRELARDLRDLGHGFADIDRVLVTHYDVDHVGVLNRVDAPVYAGATDAPLVGGERRPGVTGRKGLSQRLAAPFCPTPAGPVRSIGDGDTVGSFTVVHTPGHTPGHVSYVSERLSVAFVGDLVRESGGRLEPSPGLLSHDTAQVRASIQRLAAALPEVDVLGMGHGVPFERDGHERLRELADRL